MNRQLISISPSLVLPTSKGLLFIRVHQIIRIQSIGSYSKLYLQGDKSIVVSKVLRWFEENTHLANFIRIHRTHLINPDYIKTCGVQSSGIVFLSNGEKLKMARRKKASVVQRLIRAHNCSVRIPVCPSLYPEPLKNDLA